MAKPREDEKPVQPMPEARNVTIAAGERESEELAIPVSEVVVTPSEGRDADAPKSPGAQYSGAPEWDLRETAPGMCRIVLRQPAPDAVSFSVGHANLEPNRETAGKTSEVHKMPGAL